MLNNKIYAYLGGAWVDITSSVLSLSYSGGIKGNKETDRIASIGTLSFTLKNNSGDYTPGSGSAHADWKKGTQIKVEFTKLTTKVKFIGWVNDIGLEYKKNNNRANITAVSWLHFASNLPLDIPALQEDQRADEITTTILGFSPIQPISTSLQTGSSTFPYAFHDNTVKTTAYSEITKAVMSEWGYAYEKQDGTLVLEAYNGRATTQKTVSVTTAQNGALLLEDGTSLLLEDGTELLLEDYSITEQNATSTVISDIDISHGKHIVNRSVINVHPYKPGNDDVLVYTNETNQLIPAGETVSFRLQFTDASSKQPIAALEPSVKQYTLLHFDTPPDGVTGIVDSAVPTVLGDTTPFFEPSGGGYFTSPKKFGTASYGCNGSSDYIYSGHQEKFNFRAGDFTVDWWEYRLSATSGRAMVSRASTGVYSPYVFGYSDGTNARAYITSNGVSWDIASARDMGTITTSTWVHYAITRSGTTFRTFKNGVQQDTWTSSATINPTSDQFSLFLYNGTFLNGYIDEFRMIKGYAAYTANFTPAERQHYVSGINYSVYTSPPLGGSEITSSMTVSTGIGGVGLDFSITSASGSDGYLNLEIYALPLQSLSTISAVAENTSSINSYGYQNENVDMRLRDDINFAETIAESIVTAEATPRTVLNKVSMVANKNDLNEALFMDCDIGDLVRITDTESGYDTTAYIQAISWRAVPGDGGVIVFFDWLVKEQ